MHLADAPLQVAGHVSQLYVLHGEPQSRRPRADSGFHLCDEQCRVVTPGLVQGYRVADQSLPRAEQGVATETAPAGFGLAQIDGRFVLEAPARAGVASVQGASPGDGGVATRARAQHFVAVGGVYHGKACEHVSGVDRVLEPFARHAGEQLSVDASTGLTAPGGQVVDVYLAFFAAVAFGGDLTDKGVLLVF